MAMKVVVVEDKPLIRRAIVETIDWQAIGCELHASAGDGLEGKRMIEASRPDIIITDIRMPGMDGLQLAAYAKDILESCKVIVITGYQDFAYAKECVRIGVFEYILKPINNDEIYNTVTKAAAELRKERETLQENKQLLTLSMRQFLSELLSGQLQLTEPDGLLLRQRLQGYRFGLIVFRYQQYHEETNQTAGIDLMELEKRMQFVLTQEEVQLYHFQLLNDHVFVYVFKQTVSEKTIESMWLQRMILLKKELKEQRMGGVRFESHYPIRHLGLLRRQYLNLSDKLRMYFFNVKPGNQMEHVKLSILYELEQFQTYLATDDLTAMQERIKPYLASISIYAAGNVQVAKALVSELCISIAKLYYRKSNKELLSGKSIDTILNQVNQMSEMSQAEGYLQSLLADFKKQIEAESTGYSVLIKGVLRYIDEHYWQDISLNRVADQFHISSGHLGRLLRKETGTNFVDIVSRTRIKAAKRFMRDSTKRIQEISELTGFKNYIYFYQVFKKYEHMSPQEYKNKL